MRHQEYDLVIIGAGMSGLAAGIRAKMIGLERVAIIEKHFIPGGLNSYYSRGKYQFDVGLHALTNFAKLGDRGKPLLKICKQLRIPYNSFKLSEQNYSQIQFGNNILKFNNNLTKLRDEVALFFPNEINNFNKLIDFLSHFNETDLNSDYKSARVELSTFFKDSNLIELLLWPLLIYGSAVEEDMEFSQFAIMFKAIYLEGFARPVGGVKVIIDLLQQRYLDLGGELEFKTGCISIKTDDALALLEMTLQHQKEVKIVNAKKIFSSAGIKETEDLLKTSDTPKGQYRQGKMGFTESIFIFDEESLRNVLDSNVEVDSNGLPQSWPTITFWSADSSPAYKRPEKLFDERSAVICIPNRYQDCEYKPVIMRVTHAANFHLWQELKKKDAKEYRLAKNKLIENDLQLLKKFLNCSLPTPVLTDAFTPTTVLRYTGHSEGCVYGSPDKIKNGQTSTPGVFIIGTDQGFLGVVGAMLSGISMANLHLASEVVANENSIYTRPSQALKVVDEFEKVI